MGRLRGRGAGITSPRRWQVRPLLTHGEDPTREHRFLPGGRWVKRSCPGHKVAPLREGKEASEAGVQWATGRAAGPEHGSAW